MAYTPPVSDLARSHQHEQDRAWPESIKLQIKWIDRAGRPIVRSHEIHADEFFGTGHFGAPLSGDQIISYIERMRKAGPPKVIRGKRSARD
jgi:hypothetical protein